MLLDATNQTKSIVQLAYMCLWKPFVSQYPTKIDK